MATLLNPNSPTVSEKAVGYCAVHLLHIPTGLKVEMNRFGSRHKNREVAYEALSARVARAVHRESLKEKKDD